jgi:hypothetical protein
VSVGAWCNQGLGGYQLEGNSQDSGQSLMNSFWRPAKSWEEKVAQDSFAGRESGLGQQKLFWHVSNFPVYYLLCP